MENNASQRVQAKLFAGVLLTSEMQMYLRESPVWKNAIITAAHGSDDLIEIRHQKKSYIGCYVAEEYALLEDLEKYQQFVMKKIESYCPQLPKSSCHFRLFVEILIQ